EPAEAQAHSTEGGCCRAALQRGVCRRDARRRVRWRRGECFVDAADEFIGSERGDALEEGWGFVREALARSGDLRPGFELLLRCVLVAGAIEEAGRCAVRLGYRCRSAAAALGINHK